MSAPRPYLPFTRPCIDETTITQVGEVLRSGWLTTGPKVRDFEAQLSKYFGGRRVLCFNSGTCTLEIALRLAGVGPGHEVITTPLTWVATANVILEVGARPVFVDVDPCSRNLDLERVEAAITPATRALMPVDLAGLPVARDRLYALAQNRGLRVVEDAAQSLGSTWKGLPLGSLGDLVSFSFHANKNLTTGEGGCLVLNSEGEARLAEKYRLQGLVRTSAEDYEVEVLGGKWNMTDIAACLGLGQLLKLEDFTRRRRALARLYWEAFQQAGAGELGLGLPLPEFKEANWHMFQVLLPLEKLRLRRLECMQALHQLGIGTGVHYPVVHLLKLYRRQGWKEGDFPKAEALSRTLLTLPLFPAMNEEEVLYVVRSLTALLRANLQP